MPAPTEDELRELAEDYISTQSPLQFETGVPLDHRRNLLLYIIARELVIARLRIPGPP
jgi:hypothetical protein